MGPNHPGWRDISEYPNDDPFLRRPSPMRLPKGSIPPGARFDPIFPEKPMGGERFPPGKDPRGQGQKNQPRR
jgi:hypothetical protein